MARVEEDRPRSTRESELLRLAAEAMDDGRSPFDSGFLIEHGVTLDEVYDLSETIARATRIYLALRKRPEWLTVLTIETALGREAGARAEATMAMKRITDRLS